MNTPAPDKADWRQLDPLRLQIVDQQLYGNFKLAPRLRQMALAFLRDENAALASEKIGVLPSTGRFYLKLIFARTRCKNQPHLMKMLMFYYLYARAETTPVSFMSHMTPVSFMSHIFPIYSGDAADPLTPANGL